MEKEYEIFLQGINSNFEWFPLSIFAASLLLTGYKHFKSCDKELTKTRSPKNKYELHCFHWYQEYKHYEYSVFKKSFATLRLRILTPNIPLQSSNQETEKIIEATVNIFIFTFIHSLMYTKCLRNYLVHIQLVFLGNCDLLADIMLV